MQKVDINQATTEISFWLQSALKGEEIIITQNNQPILKLSQFPQPAKKRQRGSAKGQIWMSPDFDEPLEDFEEYM
jgi:antitoxin (DNA-binding transcriptional repressor) of toxin-antitoxin stability system